MKLTIPKEYNPVLSVRQTQEAIKYIRDTFQHEFGKEMNLLRISAPLFVEKSSGLNDDLNGTEEPVHFTMKDMDKFFRKGTKVLVDVKGVLDRKEYEAAGYNYWRL